MEIICCSKMFIFGGRLRGDGDRILYCYYLSNLYLPTVSRITSANFIKTVRNWKQRQSQIHFTRKKKFSKTLPNYRKIYRDNFPIIFSKRIFKFCAKKIKLNSWFFDFVAMLNRWLLKRHFTNILLFILIF